MEDDGKIFPFSNTGFIYAWILKVWRLLFCGGGATQSITYRGNTGSTAENTEKKETEELQGSYSVYTDILITTFLKCTHTDTLSHLYFLCILQWCVCVCVRMCRWSLAFIQIKEGMWGLAKMAWAEHCGCFPQANPCDWWLGSIKSLCWRPCQLLINPSKCLLHSGPERLLYVQQSKIHVHAHTRGKTVHTETHGRK